MILVLMMMILKTMLLVLLMLLTTNRSSCLLALWKKGHRESATLELSAPSWRSSSLLSLSLLLICHFIFVAVREVFENPSHAIVEGIVVISCSFL